MEGLEAKEREKLINRIISSNAETRLYVIKIAPIDVVIEMALKENNDYVLENIIERLEAEKDTEEVKNNLYRLAKANAWDIRKFTAGVVSIDVVIEMALKENKYNVLEIIVERLNAEKDTEEVKNNLYRLAKSNAWKIRKFTAGVVSIDVVIEMALEEEEYEVVKIIIERLEAEKDTEEVKNNLYKLSEAITFSIRKFSASIAPIGIVIEMALEENSYNVVKTIIERLEVEKYTEEVKNNLYRLAKSNAWEIRKFTAGVVSIDVIIEMALEEEEYEVVKIIIERLEAEKDTEEVKNNLYKLSKAITFNIRKFAVSIAPIDVVIKRALEENNYDVLKIIIERLEVKKDTEEVKNILYKLVKSNVRVIRKMTVSIAPIDAVIEMALKEDKSYVLANIIERLETEKYTEEVKNNLYKLAKSNSWEIRKFAVSIAPINVVIKMALEENNHDVLENIIERLEAEKDTEEVKNNLYKLVKSNSWEIHNFALNVAPLKTLEEIVMSNEDKIVIDAIRQILQ